MLRGKNAKGLIALWRWPAPRLRALASFDPIWRELFPAERARILHLLVEEVRYDAEAGEVAITFRPGGVRSLAREDGRETA